jgi:hypothetical protein
MVGYLVYGYNFSWSYVTIVKSGFMLYCDSMFHDFMEHCGSMVDANSTVDVE